MITELFSKVEMGEEMTKNITIQLRGSTEVLTVDYEENPSPEVSGFDALAIDFPAEFCIGYPTIHAYFQNMNVSGYRRYCGFIQVVKKVERSSGREDKVIQFIDVDDYSNEIGNPYFAYGYPAELYDAPCKNIGDGDELEWTAYTYLVDMPTRMNGYRLEFLTGFTWGYDENQKGLVRVHELEMLGESDFQEHFRYVREQFKNFQK